MFIYNSITKKGCLLLLVCIISRLLTSIFYIEDIDSLRFASSIEKYDVLSNSPHFPGYPLFCFILKIFFFILGSVPYTFSLLGSISIFLIIIYTHKIYYLINSNNSWILMFILFINPFLWLMSNRYMPDLFGLAILMVSIFYLLKFFSDNNKINLYFFGFFLGLLCGVRISYIPFFVPVLYFLIKDFKDLLIVLRYFIIAFSIWFIPWVIFTGFYDLLDVAINDVNGHFFRWGGTIHSVDSSFYVRAIKMIESIFADGFGCWWSDRHWATGLNSIFFISFIFLGLFKLKKTYHAHNHVYNVIFACLFLYFMWIFFYQNVIYKPRHIMPFIPFLSLFISFGFSYLYKKIHVVMYTAVIAVFFSCNLFVTLTLVSQHLNKSAISQVQSFLQSYDSNGIVLVSDGLMNYYFSKTNNRQNIIYLNHKTYHKNINNFYNTDYLIFSTFMLSDSQLKIVHKNKFYHNPYVNRLWSNLSLYQYEK